MKDVLSFLNKLLKLYLTVMNLSEGQSAKGGLSFNS